MTGTDFLQLSPESAPGRGLTSWLVSAIRAAIMDGRLRAGAVLPATRLLAGELGVSRGVVVEAYQRLADEGLVSGRPGAGTAVSGMPPRAVERPPLPPAGRAADPGSVLPRRWRTHAELDLSPGVPDLSGFPRATWLRAERWVLERASVADLGYGDPRGNEWLRRELAGWLARTRGLRAAPDDIIVVTGVAQALALVAQRLNAEGRKGIAVEDPGSRGAHDELAYWGLRPCPVPVDDHGLQVAHLAATELRAVLLTPAHQFPTGVVLAPERRRELLDWAAAADALIIEDDYDAEYRYDRAPVPALQARAPAHVAYAGSTSKTLAPGLRLGWLVPPVRRHADLVEAKHAADLGSPALPQLVLARLIASGELAQHIRQVRKRQRTRRDALLGAPCASSCQGPASRAWPRGCTCSSRSRTGPSRTPILPRASCVPGSWFTRCPGTAGCPGHPGSCWGTRRTPPISCARPRGGSPSRSRAEPAGAGRVALTTNSSQAITQRLFGA